jgi:hypothetical protein
MPVGTIYVPVAGTGEAPQEYSTPGAAILDLQAVSADFDGSGASGDFRPAVQLLDSTGNVMATVVGETVTAGDSASVTFAPFLRAPSGQTCGGSIDSTQTVGNTCGVHSVGVGSGRVLTSDGADGSSWLSPAAVHSNSAFENVATFPNAQSVAAGANTALALAHVSQSALLNFTTPTLPTIRVTGRYIITVPVIGEAAATTRNHFTLSLLVNAAAIGNKTMLQESYSPVLADQTYATVTWAGPLLVGDSLQVKVHNNDTVARNFDILYLSVERPLITF